MSAAMPSAVVLHDLNIRTSHASSSCNTTQALCELIANAFDANREAGLGHVAPTVLVEGPEVHISDNGSGLTTRAFVIGRRTAASASSLGQFGIGLKDAAAALLLAGAAVTAVSRHGKFDFVVQESNMGEMTIHVRWQPTPADSGTAPAVGTTFRVGNLVGHESVVAAARSRFLALSPLGSPLFQVEDVEFGIIEVCIAAPRVRNHHHIYVNGMQKACDSPLILEYNVIQTSAPRALCFNRDQTMIKPGAILDAVAKAADTSREKLEALRKHAPVQPSCEFARASFRALFYPVAAASGGSGGAAAPHGAAGKPAAGPSHCGTAAAVSGTASAASSVLGDPATVVLYDYENAPNASDTLHKQMMKSKGWRLLSFVQIGKEIPEALTMAANCKVVTTTTSSREAADTQLCFRAGVEHATLPATTAFVVVCGTEGRYEELVNGLRGEGRQAVLLRFIDADKGKFDAELTGVAVLLGV
jgi:hypothetical protein